MVQFRWNTLQQEMQLYCYRCHTNSQKSFSEITVTTREGRLPSVRSILNPYTGEASTKLLGTRIKTWNLASLEVYSEAMKIFHMEFVTSNGLKTCRLKGEINASMTLLEAQFQPSISVIRCMGVRHSNKTHLPIVNKTEYSKPCQCGYLL